MMARRASNDAPPLAHFTSTAQKASQVVIRSYSTSFGIATCLLGRRHRQHVRSIYAMVRVADEIVDGVTTQAGLTAAEQEEALEQYAAQTHAAMRTGYSSDLVIHAFAQTAREVGIDESLTRPFFDAMRVDLRQEAGQQIVFDSAAHAAYVYGSAEVVGLMCLRVFLRGSTVEPADRARLEHGARRLGAAFQNVNFLRDVGDDTARLGRSYLGTAADLCEQDVRQWTAQIRAQLSDAADVIGLLPRDARAAIRAALALFAELTDRVARTPAAELSRTRIRVPDGVKLVLASRAVLTTLREARR